MDKNTNKRPPQTTPNNKPNHQQTIQTPHCTPQQTHTIPHQPGVYKFYNKNHKLLYVGKAKNLRKRIKSYFNNKKQQQKTTKMVQQIATIEYTILDTEYQALLLESNIIKEQQPPYNILFKDGKTYPYLAIIDEPYPRLIFTRDRNNPKATYYGPFTSQRNLRNIQELIRELYPLRTCNYKLTPENIAKKKFKLCLEYHIGNCLGPCENRQPPDEYQKNINQVKNILKGKTQPVKKHLKEKMLQSAQQRDFIKAQQYKDKIEKLEKYHAKSLITNPNRGNLHVIAIIDHTHHAIISYLHINKGRITHTETLIVEKRLQEDPSNILAISHLYIIQKAQTQAKEILTNHPFTTAQPHTTITIPQKGDKKKILDIAIKNAYHIQKQQIRQQEQQQRQANNPLIKLQEALKLPHIPNHIECFDISNIQGKHPIAGKVHFKEGKPYKPYHRYYHIRTITQPDDTKAIAEAIHRAYRITLESHQPLPDLIIVDGGKGQRNAAFNALKKLGIEKRTTLIALAKKYEHIYHPNNPNPQILDHENPALQLLQRIRDAAHNYSLKQHRKKRMRYNLTTELTTIPNIGPKTIHKLIEKYRSTDKIKQAPKGELVQLIGARKASAIQGYYHEKEKLPFKKKPKHP